MQNKEEFLFLLDEVSRAGVANAMQLRAAAEKIISKWVNLKFKYPNEIIDRLVYIESSIEDSISDNSNDPVALQKECAEAYKFHIDNFLQTLEQLRAAIGSMKAT